MLLDWLSTDLALTNLSEEREFKLALLRGWVVLLEITVVVVVFVFECAVVPAKEALLRGV